jgi:hypothetical protein
VDWPGAPFYEKLMGRYSDAKVILTVREPEKWYERPDCDLQHTEDGHLAYLLLEGVVSV